MGGVLASSQDYTTLRSQLASEQKRLQSAQQRAICELDGTCGTDHSGAGPAYHAKAQLESMIAGQLAATEQRMRGLEGTLVSEAKTHAKQMQAFASNRLSVVGQELATLRKQYATSNGELIKHFRAPIGLLDRVRALGEADLRELGHARHLAVADALRSVDR